MLIAPELIVAPVVKLSAPSRVTWPVPELIIPLIERSSLASKLIAPLFALVINEYEFTVISSVASKSKDRAVMLALIVIS